MSSDDFSAGANDSDDEFTSGLSALISAFWWIQPPGFVLLFALPIIFLLWVMSWAPGW